MNTAKQNKNIGLFTGFLLLADRELDVLRELTRNLTNEEIAKALDISPYSVKRHIENMLAKTGYKSRIDLAVNAKTIGLVVHDDDRKVSS